MRKRGKKTQEASEAAPVRITLQEVGRRLPFLKDIVLDRLDGLLVGLTDAELGSGLPSSFFSALTACGRGAFFKLMLFSGGSAFSSSGELTSGIGLSTRLFLDGLFLDGVRSDDDAFFGVFFRATAGFTPN